MTANQRINDLEECCKQWKQSIHDAEARRDELLAWKDTGMLIFEK